MLDLVKNHDLSIRRHTIVECPLQEDVSSALRVSKSIERVVAELNAIEMDHVTQWVRERPLNGGRFQIDALFLQHRLSRYLPEVDPELVKPRASNELGILESLPAASILTAFHSRVALIRYAILLQEKFVPTGGRIRQGNVGTVSREQRQLMLYPDIADLDIALDQICLAAALYLRDAPAFMAILVWVMFTTVHPFEDGNGRVARSLFNLILRATVNSQVFIPLHELAAISRGGLLLTVREAQTEQKWEQICLMVQRCCVALATVASVGYRRQVRYLP